MSTIDCCCGCLFGGRFYNCITNIGFAGATVTVKDHTTGDVYGTYTTDSTGRFTGTMPSDITPGTVTIDVTGVAATGGFTATETTLWRCGVYIQLLLGATLKVIGVLCAIPYFGGGTTNALGTVITVTGPGGYNQTITQMTSPVPTFALIYPGVYTITTVFMGVTRTYSLTVVVCTTYGPIIICVTESLLAEVQINSGCNGDPVGEWQIIQSGTIVAQSRALSAAVCIPAGVDTILTFIPDVIGRWMGWPIDYGILPDPLPGFCTGADLFDRTMVIQKFPVPASGYVCMNFGSFSSACANTVPKALNFTSGNISASFTINYVTSGLGTQYPGGPNIEGWVGSGSAVIPAAGGCPVASTTAIVTLFNTTGPSNARGALWIEVWEKAGCPVAEGTPGAERVLIEINEAIVSVCPPGTVLETHGGDLIGPAEDWMITE